MTRHTASDMADRIGKTADYWRRAANRKEVPHRRMGRTVWWEDEDVEQIIAAALVSPKSATSDSPQGDPLRSVIPSRRRTA